MNMLFNKVLGENEKCLLILLKNQRNFLANPIYLYLLILIQVIFISTFLCVRQCKKLDHLNSHLLTSRLIYSCFHAFKCHTILLLFLYCFVCYCTLLCKVSIYLALPAWWYCYCSCISKFSYGWGFFLL